jgi:hypothetical protein
MDYEQRSEAIHRNFILRMAKMYQAPKHIKEDKEAIKLYCREVREAINKRLDSRIPNMEVMDGLLNKIWDKCIAENTYRLYFTPALVMKHASKVNADYQQRQDKADAMFSGAKQPWEKSNEVKPSKEDAAANGWTIEKCDEHISNMKRMIADGEINRYMGQRLMQIPMKAKERLINARH